MPDVACEIADVNAAISQATQRITEIKKAEDS